MAALLAAPAAARAADPRAPADPVALARAGRCEEALPGLAARRGEREPALLEGECLVKLRRYADAAPALEALVQREGSLAEAWLDLAIARFHLGDAAGCEAALDRAAPLADRPEHRLYRGLALLSRGDAVGAARLLEGMGEGSAAPIASYWAGVAWLRAGDTVRGRDALQRVAALAPDSSWALEANRLLNGVAAERPRLWWMRLTAGYEYDDNVVLRAGDAPLGREITSQRDTRTIWRVEAGSELWRSGAWSSGAWLSYSGSHHDELRQFDVQYPTLGLWLDRKLSESTILRAAYDFGWAFVDQDSFLQGHGGTLSAIHSFGALGTSQLFTRVYGYDYKVDDVDVPDGTAGDLSLCASPFAIVCGRPGVDEKRTRDRDGVGSASGVQHVLPIPALRSDVTLGYTYYHFWAEGKEQSYESHEAHVGTYTALPLGLELRLDASYAYRPYHHASTVPQPFELFLGREYPTRDYHRRDSVARFEVGLERRIAERAKVGVAYSYLDSGSNYELFDYDRQIVGTYVTLGFGPGRWAR